ncbi:hypothetical protein [methane-oxidizing endosymbiont of Gigantopelta aegis]|uniref:hypothetical protein n=1 Tax=methane-oxidizing endosymbiont of Gigantopelta aegis TaxID=2794938 RepID=UPI0018DCFA86|nr:hypothetical protein [methane-oxidizing endosymbiont of Gigantopelta aegis]
MKKQNPVIKALQTALIVMSAALLLSACSDDKPKTPLKKAEHNPFDHSHGSEVTDLVKHKFEHEFADQCAEREAANSPNPVLERKRYAKPCLCIATYMMKDLTAVEAEKFLKEHKNTQSLRIRFENAAYHCLQEKAHPKGPKLFGKR